MKTDQRIMQSGKAIQIEERVDMPDGSATYWLSMKSPLRNESDEIIGLLVHPLGCPSFGETSGANRRSTNVLLAIGATKPSEREPCT